MSNLKEKEGKMGIERLETELRIRGFSDQTIRSYVYHNTRFLEFCQKQAEDVLEEDVRKYMAHMMGQKKKPTYVSLMLSSLKFYYQEVLKKPIITNLKPPKLEKKIPTVLTKEEMKRLIAAAENPKHRLLIEMIYSSGLRVGEAVSLKIDDLDTTEKMGMVHGGKGKKDRHIILSNNLIKNLQSFLGTRQDKNPYIFPIASNHIGVRQAQNIVKNAAKKAGIRKKVFCHCLRSSFATHLLESGTDIRVIQELLGHSNLATTERYTKVSNEQLKKVKSPYDSA
jgi:integrase/recombinase XerD